MVECKLHGKVDTWGFNITGDIEDKLQQYPAWNTVENGDTVYYTFEHKGQSWVRSKSENGLGVFLFARINPRTCKIDQLKPDNQ